MKNLRTYEPSEMGDPAIVDMEIGYLMIAECMLARHAGLMDLHTWIRQATRLVYLLSHESQGAES